jgi:hypothetical protein
LLTVLFVSTGKESASAWHCVLYVLQSPHWSCLPLFYFWAFKRYFILADVCISVIYQKWHYSINQLTTCTVNCAEVFPHNFVHSWIFSFSVCYGRRLCTKMGTSLVYWWLDESVIVDINLTSSACSLTWLILGRAKTLNQNSLKFWFVNFGSDSFWIIVKIQTIDWELWMRGPVGIRMFLLLLHQFFISTVLSHRERIHYL